jgi:hypothetical protein
MASSFPELQRKPLEIFEKENQLNLITLKAKDSSFQMRHQMLYLIRLVSTINCIIFLS